MPLKHKSAIAALFFGAALCFFYLKYVPLLPPFQAFLLPVCFAVTVLSASDMQRGTVGFLFFLPLINNWPYFFGLQETTPQAPALAVVFLFYVLGWRISKIVSSREKAGDGPSPNPVETPLLAATALITISAVILLWKWTNFFPVASGGGFDLATNVNGVTTGGAVMSTVFHALSYLSGFAFFLILSREFEWKAGLRKALGALGAGLLLSILFGFYQHFLNPALGNTTFWARMGQINATFKDPNSFGVVLSMMGPVALGAFFCVRGGWRIVAGAVFGLGLLITPLIGTRSGFLGFGLALVWFAFQSLRSLSKKKRATAIGMLLVLAISTVGIAQILHTPLWERLTGSLKSLSAKGGLVNISPERYFLWKEAVAMIGNYPLTGVGVGAFIIELPNYYAEDKKTYEGGFEANRRIDTAENYFLQAGAEMGAAGLLAFLWMTWTIGTIAKRGLRRRRDLGPAWPLFLGVVAGLIAFFVNGLFHSYIGSFEASLGLWFLIALLVFLAGEETPAEPPAAEAKPSPRRTGAKRLRVALIISLVAFGGLHLWNSAHSLSLAERTKRFHLNREFGLYQHEKTDDGKEFRWTREYGGFPIKVTGPVMDIPMAAAHPGIERAPVRVEIFFIKGFFEEETRLGEIEVNHFEWKTYELSTSGIVDQEGLILIKVSRTWNPRKATGAPDLRNLGVALGAISFRTGKTSLS